MKRWPVLLLAIALAGCTGSRFSQENPPRVVTVCPAFREYSPEFQKQVAAELREPTTGPGVKAMITDYKGLRDQVRACQEKSDVSKQKPN